MSGVVADDDDDGNAAQGDLVQDAPPPDAPATRSRNASAAPKQRQASPDEAARRADFNKVRAAIREAMDEDDVRAAWDNHKSELDRIKAHSQAGYDMLKDELKAALKALEPK
jgi:hypothetical protein